MILGFAVGGGQYFVAVVTAVVITVLMLWLTPLKKRIHRPNRRSLTYVSIDRPALLADVTAILGGHGINISDVKLSVEGEVVTTRLEVNYPDHLDWDMIVSKVTQVPSVISVVLEKGDHEYQDDE
jgi:putative Mg2+ transporter-C (MgtC) family protein